MLVHATELCNNVFTDCMVCKMWIHCKTFFNWNKNGKFQHSKPWKFLYFHTFSNTASLPWKLSNIINYSLYRSRKLRCACQVFWKSEIRTTVINVLKCRMAIHGCLWKTNWLHFPPSFNSFFLGGGHNHCDRRISSWLYDRWFRDVFWDYGHNRAECMWTQRN